MMNYVTFDELVEETMFKPEQEEEFHMLGVIPQELTTRDRRGVVYDERLRRVFVVAHQLAFPSDQPCPERIYAAVRQEKERTEHKIKTGLECLSYMETENDFSLRFRRQLQEQTQYLGCLNLFQF